MIVFSELKRCHNPQFTQFFQEAKKQAAAASSRLANSGGPSPERSPGAARRAAISPYLRGVPSGPN